MYCDSSGWLRKSTVANAKSILRTDTWSAESTVNSSGQVSFTIDTGNYGYDLYCATVGASIKSVSLSGTTLTYTLEGAATGAKCKLRILG